VQVPKTCEERKFKDYFSALRRRPFDRKRKDLINQGATSLTRMSD